MRVGPSSSGSSPASNPSDSTMLPDRSLPSPKGANCYSLDMIECTKHLCTLVLALAVAFALTACRRATNSTSAGQPTRSTAGQASGATESKERQAEVAAKIWSGLLSDLAPGNENPAGGWFAQLDAPESSGFATVEYTVFPCPILGRLDAGEIQVQNPPGQRFDLHDLGLRPADAAWMREIAKVDPPTAARRLDAFDRLLAGVMRSAAKQDARYFYKYVGAWRGHFLTRLAELGPAGEAYTPNERLTKVKSLIQAPTMTSDVR